VIEVVAEDKGGAGDSFFGAEREGDAVLVMGVGGVGEVGGCGGGVVGEAYEKRSVRKFI